MVQVVGKDQSKVKRTTCGNCASVLEYTLSEVQSFIHHDYGGGSDSVHYIVCPTCGHKANVRGY